MAFSYDIKNIEKEILSFLEQEEGYAKTVIRAMNEAILNGGKRIRPILMYETYKLFSKNIDESLYIFMAAIEMIHTFSLIHDDLPCMDNDTLRRGKPTTWVSFGEDMAVLAGDGLVIEAFELIARKLEKEQDISKIKRLIRANAILANKSGIRGMIGGQVLDVEKTGKPLSKEELDYIYRLKTAALLEASMMIGAVLAGACEEKIKLVEGIAKNIGISFQIRDDILDEISTKEELGKPVHSDIENNKSTYVCLYGLDKAKKDVEELSKRAVSDLSYIDADTSTLKEIINYLIFRKN